MYILYIEAIERKTRITINQQGVMSHTAHEDVYRMLAVCRLSTF
jgi:hypothetical protein